MAQNLEKNSANANRMLQSVGVQSLRWNPPLPLDLRTRMHDPSVSVVVDRPVSDDVPGRLTCKQGHDSLFRRKRKNNRPAAATVGLRDLKHGVNSMGPRIMERQGNLRQTQHLRLLRHEKWNPYASAQRGSQNLGLLAALRRKGNLRKKGLLGDMWDSLPDEQGSVKGAA